MAAPWSTINLKSSKGLVLYFDESYDLLDRRTINGRVPNVPDVAGGPLSAYSSMRDLLHLRPFRRLSLDKSESEPPFTLYTAAIR